MEIFPATLVSGSFGWVSTPQTVPVLVYFTPPLESGGGQGYGMWRLRCLKVSSRDGPYFYPTCTPGVPRENPTIGRLVSVKKGTKSRTTTPGSSIIHQLFSDKLLTQSTRRKGDVSSND